MDGIIMAAQLILGLSILVLIHEAGHYFAARIFGIRVDKFYLFFDAWGYKLFSIKRGDTEYGIGWLPLGGYCKIAGMVDESMDTSKLKEAPKPYEYRSKPAWQRLIVISAGVFLNLILGIVIFSMLLLCEQKSYLSVSEVNKYGIHTSPYAKEVGLQNGDKIISFNGNPVERFQDLQSTSILFGGNICVERNSTNITIELPDSTYRGVIKQKAPFISEYNIPVIVDSVYSPSLAHSIGLQKLDTLLRLNHHTFSCFGEFKSLIAPLSESEITLSWVRGQDTLTQTFLLGKNSIIGFNVQIPYVEKSYNAWTSLKYGTKDAFTLISSNIKGIKKIFSGKEKASESVQGPIGIATIYGSYWDWGRFWYITAMLSLILAFMNILPIPALDGGHILFTLYEIMSGKKPSDKFLEYAQSFGMLLLFALMIFAVGNDILRLFK